MLQVSNHSNVVQQKGLATALAGGITRRINRVITLRALRALTLRIPRAAFLEAESPFQGAFLDIAQLKSISAKPDNDLTPEFVHRALAKGDQCYALLDGGVVAHYGWYSTAPTDIDVPGLVLSFDPDYVYMYKAFTHPKYRGRRLHAVGVSQALAHYRSLGYNGIFCYVDWNNFNSLRSSYRMGYDDLGAIWVLGLLRHYLILQSQGCKQFGVRLMRANGSGLSIGDSGIGIRETS